MVYFRCKIVFSFLGQLLPPWCKLRTDKICINFQKATSESLAVQGFHPLSIFFSGGACPLIPLARLCWCAPPCTQCSGSAPVYILYIHVYTYVYIWTMNSYSYTYFFQILDFFFSRPTPFLSFWMLGGIYGIIPQSFLGIRYTFTSTAFCKRNSFMVD